MVVTKLPSSAAIGTRQRAHRIAVDMDDAGAAMAGAAAILGAGQVGGVAQRPEQGRLRVHPVVDGLAVHGKAGHAATR